MIHKYSVAPLNYLLFVPVLFILSCIKSDDPIHDRKWIQVWEDEFEGRGGTPPDPTKWTYDIGTGWGNAQLEYDTDRRENVALDGKGHLAITARRESFAGSAFTSARIKTEGLFEQRYGRFEARIKLPFGPGIWPAFWMLGSNITEVDWPQCGEIDIMEYRGQEPTVIHGSVHGPGYSAGNPVTKTFTLNQARFDSDFHVFAVEWGEDFIDFFVDDIPYQRITPDDVPGEWVYNTPFYIILNVAVGGNFVGFPSPGTQFPQTMLVDYVRVFRQG